MNQTGNSIDKTNPITQRTRSNIAARIQFKEAILQYILAVRNQTKSSSDFGWLLSLATGDAGTLLAVLNGKKARRFDAIIQKLEREIILLKVEEKMEKSHHE